ncbi:hypothetical protein GQQ18_11140 [Pantoea agglomerans]|uniref:hypothetical protein n=1 Tax=Enterobacter agglomerans TaxID=549 RepID=UPI0013D6D668|nr:hypothetical protein [Pantoea agglomerans]NEG67140.1 hypothetical protein [Pantoea agglomerans]
MPVAKHRAARIKTPGAFLNNAKRWPGYGRTSGMWCVIARAEPAPGDLVLIRDSFSSLTVMRLLVTWFQFSLDEIFQANQ